jgi:2-phospho-L-lactate transferase/gluconeogenesis factor (CofD/UPF0052 family)
VQPTTVKIVSIGGGTGHSKLYIALRHIFYWITLVNEFPGDLRLRKTSKNQSKRLSRLLSQFVIQAHALVGTWDSGGSTGLLRKTIGASGSTADVTKIYGVLANPEGFIDRLATYAPLLCKAIGTTLGPEAIQSLSDLAGITLEDSAKISLSERLRFRYSPDDPRLLLRGNTIQNVAAASLAKQLQSEREGLEIYRKLIGAPEAFRVGPLSWESAKLGVTYEDGTKCWDESIIDQRPKKDRGFDPHFHRAKHYRLDPSLEMAPEAGDAIQADVFICPPGSIANHGGALDIAGVKDAIFKRFGPRKQQDRRSRKTIWISNLTASPPDSQYHTALSLKDRLQGMYGISFDNIICNTHHIPRALFSGCAEQLDLEDLIDDARIGGFSDSFLTLGSFVSQEALKQGRIEHEPYLLAIALIPLLAEVAANKRAAQQPATAGTLV